MHNITDSEEFRNEIIMPNLEKNIESAKNEIYDDDDLSDWCQEIDEEKKDE